MKTRHLFTFAMAAFALSFAACSDDDDVRNANSEPQPGKKGALVEGISINFGESEGAHTRAYQGEQKGEGTEGMIYEAFLFAKEANPTHPRALDGDWTVIRVTANDNGEMVTETGGINPEAITKDKLEKAINAGSTKDVQWLVKDVARFKGVRQGDYVYVIANDPNLTLNDAALLAHNGEASEDGIKGYIANINKDYLNGLTFAPETPDKKSITGKLLPSGRFFMAGREMIPVSPNIPSNGDFSMTIGLDREVAKVNFTAIISNNGEDAAKDKVIFKEDDGIVVARIARKASPFTEQTPEWYVPSNCVENWPINNHALAGNNYAAFCDGTREGSFIFDGTSADPITDWIKGTTIPAGFNNITPASNITEYRYSWKLDDKKLTDETRLVYLSPDSKTIFAPVFYTTPNYSNNTNSVTVICTQATYIDRGVFKNSNMIDTYVDAALNAQDKIEIFSAEEVNEATGKTDGAKVEISNPLKYNSTSGQLKLEDIVTKVKLAIKNWGIKGFADETAYNDAVSALSNEDKTAWNLDKAPSFEDYQVMMDRFYVAVLLQQRLANKGKEITGNQSAETVEGWGNGITTGTKGYYTNADTDSLMMGYKKVDNKNLLRAFYFAPTMTSDKADEMLANAMTPIKFKNDQVEVLGSEIRYKYFADLASYEYLKGQKLYYRADVANYVGGVSNRITERNMYYKSKGTIQSLGAKSIHDAIYSDQNTMHIDVEVNDWKLSVNDIPM